MRHLLQRGEGKESQAFGGQRYSFCPIVGIDQVFLRERGRKGGKTSFQETFSRSWEFIPERGERE